MDPKKPQFPGHPSTWQQQTRGRGRLSDESAIGRGVPYGRGVPFPVCEPPVGFARGLPQPSRNDGLGRARELPLSTAEPTVGVARGAPLLGLAPPPRQPPPGQTITHDLPEEMPGLQTEEEAVLSQQMRGHLLDLRSSLVSMFRGMGIEPSQASWARGTPAVGFFLPQNEAEVVPVVFDIGGGPMKQGCLGVLKHQTRRGVTGDFGGAELQPQTAPVSVTSGPGGDGAPEEVMGRGSRCHLLDLPWEDVLVTHIFCYLPLRHLVQLQRVSKQFHALIQVYLANCRTFDLTQLGPYIPKEAFCTMLRDNRVLRNLGLQTSSNWVTDQELLPVIGQNQHLQRVDMRGCVWLTRHSLVALSLSCMHLQHLGLAHCKWVDSLSLRSLSDHCAGLRSIDLTACRQLKDEDICYLAKKCLQLRSLSVAVNNNITDESVEEVAKHCRELEQLDLTGCLWVRNQSIRTVGEYCPKLQSLKINHCRNVTESSLDPLRKRNVEIDVDPPLERALVLLGNWCSVFLGEVKDLFQLDHVHWDV